MLTIMTGFTPIQRLSLKAVSAMVAAAGVAAATLTIANAVSPLG